MDGSDRYDSNDDILRYFDFSEPEPLPLPPPPPPPPPGDGETLDANPAADDQMWDLDVIGPMIESLAGISMEDENEGIITSSDEIFVPLTPGHLDCSRCLVLREVFHTNGLEIAKLVIHGGLETFNHATFDVEHLGDGVEPRIEHYYLDLSVHCSDWVKNWLQDYTMRTVNGGGIILQDSISALYNALCSGIGNDVASSSTTAPCSQAAIPELAAGSSPSTPLVAVGEISSIKIPKTGIAAQRERTGNMKLEDLVGCFHLPIATAAKELSVCSTALKHICRKHGLRRWPHRKIRSLDNKISRLESDLRGSRSSEGAASIQEEIETLRGKRARICTGEP